MLLSISFAKAQLVTMYDVPFKSEKMAGNSVKLEFENTESKILANIYMDRYSETPDDGSFLKIDGRTIFLRNQLEKLGTFCTAYKIDNRIHVICVNKVNKKCLYGFYDEQPDPRDEFKRKALQRGF